MWFLAVSTAGAALGASAFLAFFPPPSTFSLLYPPRNPLVLDGNFSAPVCNGLQCRLCPYLCFLPEGATGRCKRRINYGGRIKTLIYVPQAVPLAGMPDNKTALKSP